MFHRILPRIATDRPDLPVFSIHDSLVTTKGNEEYIEGVMFEELHGAIDIRPHFKKEYWTRGIDQTTIAA